MKTAQWIGIACAFILGSLNAAAQGLPATSGTLVVVPALGEVKQANDEAVAILMIEEHDKDKSAAASRVNQKMREGTDIVRRADPTATLKTRGYYTYPIYQEDQPRAAGKARQPNGWRVGQYLEVTTTNLATLPKTVASAQKLLVLNGLRFGLSDTAAKKLDRKRIAAAYSNLMERIDAIAAAMGRNPSEAMLDTVDLEGGGNVVPMAEVTSSKAMSMRGAPESAQVEEPSFEPGETTLQMRIVGKVRFR